MQLTAFIRMLVLSGIFAGVSAQTALGEIRLPRIFGSHMVLQQNRQLVFWGWGEPNESVTVAIGADRAQAKASERGEWKATLPARKAGGPLTVKISGSSEVVFEDVLVGEVWLASGQSNMEMGIGACQDGKAEIAAADHPQIRLFLVANRWTPMPQSDLEAPKSGASMAEGTWKVCSPQTVGEAGWGGFSAAAYYFGRELHQKLRVPVGLIDATWGGTRIESWTPPEGFASVPTLKGEYERVQLADPRTTLHRERLEQTLRKTAEWLDEARQALSSQTVAPAMPTFPEELLPPRDVQHATALYNGMIHPLHPFPLRGAIWYQGESNSGEGRLYTERMKALIQGWRQVWNEPELAFYYVQIAPYDYGGNGERIGEFWEAQAEAQSVPNSGMVVINDIGNLKDIHPTNKQDVGRRLAAWALAKQYGKTDVVYSGPTFKALSLEGDKLRITFDHAQGLASRDSKPLSWFEIIDADEGGFVPAQAKIEGATVVLSSPDVKRPVAMRFAWHMLAEPNLMNSAGLPAGAFRAGDVPKRDLLGLKVPEAKQYKLVLDLDLAKLGPTITYDVDNRASLNSPFDRVAYFVELQGEDGEPKYLYASMDAFTGALDKVGIPTVASGAQFQQNVANLTVYSNVRGIVSGTNLAGGNIEFWPANYGTANSADVPNASAQVYDFGDQPGDPQDGYGCMQVHNHDAKQTLFAINHWREGQKADLGIGNQPSGNPDWTFAGNAGKWQAKRLRVLARFNSAKPANPPSTGAAEAPAPLNWTTQQDHKNMMEQLGIVRLRPGPSGNPSATNSANYDPAKANPFPDLPEILTLKNGQKVTSPETWWNKRRAEIVDDFEREVVGRVPNNVPKVTWTVVSNVTDGLVGNLPANGKRLIGHVDNSACPAITVDIRMAVVTPAKAKGPVPVLMMFGGFFGDGLPRPAGTPAPTNRFADFGGPFKDPPSTEQLLAAGWGYATINPGSVQPDNGAALTKGIIGLVNKGQPRKPDDWGALRAWAWGAARGLDYLETDPAVDAKKVGIEGVSRFGKAALVAMAFEPRFAVVLVGSSGEGGAKLHRRNFGEAVENLTGSGEYHWMAGNFLKYGAAEASFGSKNAGDLPVDAHMLIALCAPRPTFISYGIPERGDANWLDQQGSYMATVAAGPVFRLLGARDLGVTEDYRTAKMPPVNTGLLEGELAWRQHDGGHEDRSNMNYFIAWANTVLKHSPPN